MPALKESKKHEKSKSKNKERIDVIREELKELSYELSKGELKEIKKNLYQIENKKGLLEQKNPGKYLDELDEKIHKLDKYYHYDDFELRSVQDLFQLSINEGYYKPKLVMGGYNNNYTQYESKRDTILMVKEYLGLIEPYLADMINDYKSKDKWKIQLTADQLYFFKTRF